MDLAKYGPWAVIVGGSEGVGECLARRLAADGFKLALCARKTGPLEALADDLRSGAAEVRTVSLDLATNTALDTLRTITDDIDVGLFIYNAGSNYHRDNFIDIDETYFRALLNMNVNNLAEFTRHFGARMKARGRGGIINCGSNAEFLGLPTLATYCGAKAFIRTWSESLWAECRPFNIDVLHFVMGKTATPAMARLGYTTEGADMPDDIARDMLLHVADGPVWFAGTGAFEERCRNLATFDNRGERILATTPPTRAK